MRSIVLLRGAFALLFVHVIEALAAENTCTPLANGYEAIDDSPAINEAIGKCGDGGTIMLPSSEIYSIRSPIDFSQCKNCDFQIEGTLITARGQWDYWRNSVDSVFTIANATGVRIRSVTGKGVIDGNAIDFYARSSWDPHRGGRPFVHVTNGSSNIRVENLLFKNVMQRFFILEGNSTALRFNNLRLTTEQQNGIYAEFDTVGFEMGQVQDVDIENVAMDFRVRPNQNRAFGTCVAFDAGTKDVRVRDVTCRHAWGGALIMLGTIFPIIRSDAGASNILVSNFIFDGDHATGMQSWWTGQKMYVNNVTWDGVTIESGTPAEFFPCYASMRETSYIPRCYANVAVNATDVFFKDFRGRVGKMPTDPNWGRLNNLTLVEAHFEDWVNETTKMV